MSKPRKPSFSFGDRVQVTIGDSVFIGKVVPLSTFGPVNPKDYIAIRSDDGKAHLALRWGAERA